MINDYFGKFGRIEDVRIIRDKSKKNRVKIYGFVLFEDENSLEEVKKTGLMHHLPNGLTIQCKQTMLREELKEAQKKEAEEMRKVNADERKQRKKDKKRLRRMKKKLEKLREDGKDTTELEQAIREEKRRLIRSKEQTESGGNSGSQNQVFESVIDTKLTPQGDLDNKSNGSCHSTDLFKNTANKDKIRLGSSNNQIRNICNNYLGYIGGGRRRARKGQSAGLLGARNDYKELQATDSVHPVYFNSHSTGNPSSNLRAFPQEVKPTMPGFGMHRDVDLEIRSQKTQQPIRHFGSSITGAGEMKVPVGDKGIHSDVPKNYTSNLISNSLLASQNLKEDNRVASGLSHQPRVGGGLQGSYLSQGHGRSQAYMGSSLVNEVIPESVNNVTMKEIHGLKDILEDEHGFDLEDDDDIDEDELDKEIDEIDLEMEMGDGSQKTANFGFNRLSELSGKSAKMPQPRNAFYAVQKNQQMQKIPNSKKNFSLYG